MFTVNDCVHVVKGITYNVLELQTLYEELKPYRRTRALVLENKNKNGSISTDPDVALQSQIMKSHSQIVDQTKPGYDVGRHPIVQKLLNQFKIKINPDLVDINCFRPGFEFHPHTDQVQCTVMFPIIPLDTGAPIDFYYREGLEVKSATEYRHLTASDRFAEHHYSNTHPSIINQRQIHGVRRLDHERVYLRFKINDYSFLNLVELDNQGQLT
jgi:hypothetical protein